LNELALFAGVGGGLLAASLLGWRTVCAVEINPYCIEILLQRQKDGCFPIFPIWDDIKTFDGKPWKGRIHIITGGFPCQPFSTAHHGERTAEDLWPEMYRVIREVEPIFVFGENVTREAITTAAADCSTLGYHSEVLTLSASNMGADHQRTRHWFLAHSNKSNEFFRSVNVQARELSKFNTSIWSEAPEGWKQDQIVADKRQGLEFQGERQASSGHSSEKLALRDESTSASKSRRNGMVNGMAARVDRYSAIGEGQVPAVSTTAFSILIGKIINNQGEHHN
jgi:DNA (cytosine-5)-methyltransferase 1